MNRRSQISDGVSVRKQKQRKSLIHKRSSSLSSMQRKDLNKTKRVGSVNRFIVDNDSEGNNCNSNNNKALQLIESVKTARVTTTTMGSTTNKNNNNNNNTIITKNKTTPINNEITKQPLVNHKNNNSKLHLSPPQHFPKLTSIPLSISNPQQITHLDYSNNKITTIPKHIHLTYTNLTYLNLSHNQLTSIQPLCLFKQMKCLYLQSNLINFIPKEIKGMGKLQLLDLKNNKLWYMSQIVALKQLVRFRYEVYNQKCEILLQGNSIMGTNKLAVERLLYMDVSSIQCKIVSIDGDRMNSDGILQGQRKIYNNKNNDNSNNNNNQVINKKKSTITITSNNNINNNNKNNNNNNNNNPNNNINNNDIIPSPTPKTASLKKHTRSKSLNQSLLDMSAIIAATTSTTNIYLPSSSMKTTINHNHPNQMKQNNNICSNNINRPNDNKNNNNFNPNNLNNNNQFSIRQIISQQLLTKNVQSLSQLSPQNNSIYVNKKNNKHSNIEKNINHNNNANSQFLMIMQQQQQLKQKQHGNNQQQLQQQQNPLHYTYHRLLLNVNTLQEQIITPSIECIKQFNEIQKKLLLTQRINGIPQQLKDKFTKINQYVLQKMSKTKSMLLQLQGLRSNNDDKLTNNQIKSISLLITNYINQKQLSKLTSTQQQKQSNHPTECSKQTINQFHRFIIKYYLNSNSQNNQLKWYQVWVNQYQHLLKLYIKVDDILYKYKNLWSRVKKLARVSNKMFSTQLLVSTNDSNNNDNNFVGNNQNNYQQKFSLSKPQRKNTLHMNQTHSNNKPNKPLFTGSQSKKSTSRKQLNKLLFSQTKQNRRQSLFCSQQKKQSLLLSAHNKTDSKNNVTSNGQFNNNDSNGGNIQQSISNSPYNNKNNKNINSNKNNTCQNVLPSSRTSVQDCLQCPLRQQQILAIKQQLFQQKQKTSLLQNQLSHMKQTISQINTFNDQYQKITTNQHSIIQQIQSIKPSTYQNVLLQQALALQQLIEQKNVVTGQFKSNYDYLLGLMGMGQTKSKGLNKQNNFCEQNNNNNKTNNNINCSINNTNSPSTQQLINQRLLTQQQSITKSNNNKNSNNKHNNNKNTHNSTKSIQRTYFKSNGANSVQVNNNNNNYQSISTNDKLQTNKSNQNQNKRRTSLSNKNHHNHNHRPFSIQSKSNHREGLISSQSQSRGSFPLRQLSSSQHPHPKPFRNDSQPSQKNQVFFQKIIVTEFMNGINQTNCQSNNNNHNNSTNNQTNTHNNMKQINHHIKNINNNNKQQSINLQKNNYHTKNQYTNQLQYSNNNQKNYHQQQQRDLINSNFNYNNANFNHLQNQQQITNKQIHTFSLLRQKNSLQNKPNHKILSQNIKTTPDLHFKTHKLPLPDGYNYETIDLHEKDDYKVYIKYHLRNNIKLLLDQKYLSCDDHNLIARNKLIGKDRYFFNDKNTYNKTLDPCKILKQCKNTPKREVKSLSCQKLQSGGKYIRKPGDQHGK